MKPFLVWSVLILNLLIMVPAMLLAEPKQAAPKPPPIVTVTKQDGSTVKGNVTSIDPREVVVTPVAKPKEAPPAAVTVPWKEIRSLSNGMTHKRVLDQWKKERPDQLCEACKGDLTVRCDTCKGTGHDPAAGKDCRTCGGELLVACATRQCSDGKVDCPAPCLKLTQGTWVKKEDGKRWRTFTVGKLSAIISESHVGELLVNKPGEPPELAGTCPTCRGTTEAECPKCRGTQNVPCTECTARKDAAACPSACKAGQAPCGTCEGVGMKKS